MDPLYFAAFVSALTPTLAVVLKYTVKALHPILDFLKFIIDRSKSG